MSLIFESIDQTYRFFLAILAIFPFFAPCPTIYMTQQMKESKAVQNDGQKSEMNIGENSKWTTDLL